MRQLMFSFEGLHAPKAILDGVRRGEISSFCLFGGKNVESPAQLRALTDEIREAARAGGQAVPLIGIDQEGGQLMAVTGGATELPGNMALGATRSEVLAEEAGQVLARELLAMGANLNFAPSVDVNINPANPVIGVRSFGDDAEVVAKLGAAMVRGMQGAGLLATAKHFPGHGDVAQDTHHADAVVAHPMPRIVAVELAPFRAAIAAGVAAVMSAHIRVDALDAVKPATVSREVLTNLLRQDMGFAGLIITDAMDMHAVAQMGAEVSVRAALEAGADLVLLGHLEDQPGLMAAVAALEDPAAVARVDAARAQVPEDLPGLEVVGCGAHQAVARRIAEQSITVVRQNGVLPLKLDAKAEIAVITPVPRNLTPADTSGQVKLRLDDSIRERHINTLGIHIPSNPSRTEIAAVLDAVSQADVVIMGTIDATRFENQAELVRQLHARHPNLIVAALRTPYDIMAFPQVENYLCTYSIRPASVTALARVLFGEIEAVGVLPCAIPGVEA